MITQPPVWIMSLNILFFLFEVTPYWLTHYVTKCWIVISSFLENKDAGFLSFRNINYVKVIEIIRSLTNTTSCGTDGIKTEVLKRFCRIISPPLTHVINLILTKLQWPKIWKVGIVSPVPKKSDLTQACNWRPVVLNNVMSKVAELVINKQLADHLEEKSLLLMSQHAYRKAKSCGSAWQDIDTFVSKALSEGKVCGLILTDQSAAFNVLMKEILDKKLPLYGLSSDACKLINNYLDVRSTMCQVAGERSTLVKLTSGVPEGSILGPILYTLAQMCVPVVPRIVKEKILENQTSVKKPEEVSTDSVEYADDVTGLLSTKDEDDFQEAVDLFMSEYSTYFSKCGLALNLNKCAVIVFRPGPKSRTIMLDGQEEEKHVKLLGLTVNDRYSFSKHALKVKSTIEYRLSCLKKILKFYDVEKKKQICQALIMSVASYGLEYYGREEHLHGHIQVSLNKVARTILDEAFDAEVKKMLQRLKWSNIKNLYHEALGKPSKKKLHIL